MAPSVSPPISKMAQPQRTASQDSTADGIRKRVCKACDRCRLKKSKCDGSHPCSRCRADNAICVFGERKKSHDKVYPKGYVEMLEQQQSQLVSGLQEMYRRLRTAQQWDGTALSETNGHPLTHDILAALNLLESKHDGSQDLEAFEEDVQKLQARLLAEGAGYAHRRGSMSSDSEHSLPGHSRSISNGTPVSSRPAMFNDSFQFSAPSSPHSQTSVPMVHHQPPQLRRPAYPTPQSSHMSQRSLLSGDPTFYQAEWAFPEADPTDKMMRARYAAMQAQMEQDMSLAGGMAELEQPHSQCWNGNGMAAYDMGVASLATTWPAQQLMTAYTNLPRNADGNVDLEGMDIDLNQYIQAAN